MKKLSKLIIIVGIIASALSFSSSSCITDSGESDKKETSATVASAQAEQPWNVTVYLDLSDRIIREMVPSQTEYDSIAINAVFSQFLNHLIKGKKIAIAKDCFRIIVEPTPQLPKINEMVGSLNIDLSAALPPEKKKILNKTREVFPSTISQIYDKTLDEKNWVGCDIWGFFSDKRMVDKLCIRPGYRNIIVVITDGYLFDTNHKKKEGNAYSYVTHEVLKANPKMSLICQRNGLQDLEVLMLCVNPFNKNEGELLTHILDNWFNAMEVGKVEIYTNGTNTPQYINSFFNE